MTYIRLHAFPPLMLRPGRWLGKAIRAGESEGYNLFSSSRKMASAAESSDSDGLPSGTRRELPFRFLLYSESVFDRGESSSLDYGEVGVNGPLFGGMRDEVRPLRPAYRKGVAA